MTTRSTFQTLTHTPTLVLATAALLLAAPVLYANPAKGAERQMQLSRSHIEPAPAPAASTTQVMNCPTCKDVVITVTEQSFKAVSHHNPKPVLQHQCPDCGTKLVRRGHGKARTSTAVHLCKSCSAGFHQ